jgi:DNA-binding response OmpR family regulator
MLNRTVVVVDDEADIRELLNYNLRKEGFIVKSFSNPIPSIDYLQNHSPDVILSDWLMPEMDGLEFCRKLKMSKKFKDIPLIMITCKSDETDIVTALEIGADDYLIKPFRIKELITRIKKIIRTKEVLNSQNQKEDDWDKSELSDNHLTIQQGTLVINEENYTVTLDNEPLFLTISEFKLLKTLVQNSGKVFTRHQLINSLNGDTYLVTERTVDVKIVNLRKKLGKYHYFIKTVRSLGYKFDTSA